MDLNVLTNLDSWQLAQLWTMKAGGNASTDNHRALGAVQGGNGEEDQGGCCRVSFSF
ncbi:hypothetical protein BDQ17DRAFT_1371822 [Cyathus striatus]|nr:hypothetical protein BDQ17DRAFT_1382874 [Cyathus striatus]KAF8990509.1 hypothetical protein BDQ17DRAFT_1371822 [Cyathus striatus]